MRGRPAAARAYNFCVPHPRGFLRENAFLVAAVSLPLVVVAFFLMATTIPRWLVPPPAYDLVLRSENAYDPARPRVAVEFNVRDGRVEAIVRGIGEAAYPQVPKLYLFEHATMNVRELALDLPADVSESGPPLVVPIPALAGRRVVAQARAPDGYELNTRTYRSTGFVGDLFGIGSHAGRFSLVNRGRVVPLALPADRYGYGHAVTAVGWVIGEGSP